MGSVSAVTPHMDVHLSLLLGNLAGQLYLLNEQYEQETIESAQIYFPAKFPGWDGGTSSQAQLLLADQK